MSTAPYSNKMWAKVRYRVVVVEERVVEIPVPFAFDPNNPEGMLTAVETAAKLFYSPVMTKTDFNYDQIDIQFKKPEIEAAYDQDAQGNTNHNVVYHFKPIPIVCFDEEGAIDCEFDTDNHPF